MAPTITPMLMFQGGIAEEALAFYVSIFPDAEILAIDHYGPGEPGEGLVRTARFRVQDQVLLVIDSVIDHEFDFTPSFSLFVECGSETEMDTLFGELSRDGVVMMPPDDYGFSRRFAWVADRFGVSWQLNLA
ncbi:MAG TPA: VOC family protein [Longimicrobiales bacterium]|nr:VOC family protein [Longimicrobiales bacterium]